MEMEADRLLADVVIGLLVRAADAWSRGDLHTTGRLCAAAWRLVGTGTFTDCDCPNPDNDR